MNSCIGEPISWLRLERYQLDELPAAERSEVEQHLAKCPRCGECFAHVNVERELPALPLSAADNAADQTKSHWPTWLRWPSVSSWSHWQAWASVGIASAAALLIVWTQIEPARPPGPRLRTKGGEFAFELVRMAADGHLRDAAYFNANDRFKVLLTCPPAFRGHAQLVVYQAGQAYFPWSDQALNACGNRINLPGAFRLDGTQPATVCVALGATLADRQALTRGVSALPALSVCAELAPAGAER